MMKWSRARMVIFGATGAVAVGLAAVGAYALSQDEPSSEATRIECPAMGPSGQTGEMTCYEAIPTPFAGGEVEFGPYRLLPPGTKFIERDYGTPPAPDDFRDEDDAKTLRTWPMYVPPPAGVQELSLVGQVVRGEPFQLRVEWEKDGKVVHAVMTDYPEILLPVDVYLHPAESRITVKAEMIDGRFAIIQEPSTGPAPNVGYVAIWLDGVELALRSADFGHDVLRSIASDASISG